MKETPAQERSADAKLLYAAYGRKPLNILITVICTVVVGSVLWPIFPAPAVSIWIAAMLLAQLFGYFECLAFQRANPGPSATAYWQRVFLAQSAVSGIAWAVGPTLLIGQSTGAESALFVGTLLSVSSVAMISVAEQRGAMIAMIVSMFFPPMIAFWWTGGAVELRVVVVLLCGMTAAITVGIFFNGSMRKLVEAQMRTDKMLNVALGAVIGTDDKGRITRWSHHAEAVFGWTREAVIGRSFETTIIPRQRISEDGRQVTQLLIDGDEQILNRKLELIATRQDGHEFPIELVLTAYKLDNEFEFTVFVADITQRKQTEERLLAANQLLALEFDQAPLAVIDWDLEFRVARWNPAAEVIFGYSAAEAVGQHAMFIVPEAARASIAAVGAGLLSGKGGDRSSNENIRSDGQIIQCEWYNASLRDLKGNVVGATSLVADVTARKKAEDEIQNLAFHDPLTQLPNRRLLLDRLKHAVASSTRSEKYTALMFVDLDKFKSLNDHHGHDVGDMLLQEVGHRLNDCVRDVDTVARIGGDEFIVMLEALSEKRDEASARAEAIGRKILLALKAPYELDGKTYRSSSSIGITLFTNFAGTADELLKRADLAMYQAKASGGNTLSLFDPGLQAELSHRLVLEAELQNAVQNREFVLYYQAQVVDDMHLSGVEALVRWNHPQRGVFVPADFISIMEKTGLIQSLGRWVLQTACAQLAEWAKRPEMSHLTIAVNVSANQLRLPTFVDDVLAIIQTAGADPRRLKLELTESQLVYDIDDVVSKMTLLKAAGVGFALDDFGTGYSSLSYVKRLPLDELKIDQGFIRHVLDDAIDAAIATMVVALAKSMNLSVIAEGVENEAQRLHLARQGCNRCQGYLFSRPLPLDEFEKFAVRKVQRISAQTGA